MLKICKVILNNQYVTVVNFGGMEIQFPSIRRKADEVNVLFENGKYMIVDDNYQLKAEKSKGEIKSAKNTKKRKKKTTNETQLDNKNADD